LAEPPYTNYIIHNCQWKACLLFNMKWFITYLELSPPFFLSFIHFMPLSPSVLASYSFSSPSTFQLTLALLTLTCYHIPLFSSHITSHCPGGFF
jgi:hypothetical protein